MNPGLNPSVAHNPGSHAFQPEVPWELPREKLIFKKKIGEGSFGEVWRAKVDGILGRRGKEIVAVKLLKDYYTPEEKRCLMKELRVMQTLQPHPNIISLLGCCSVTEPLCIVMEYAANGNLQDVLRKQRYTFLQNDLSNLEKRPKINLTARDLTIFTLHVSSGMQYISSRDLLHRDLAARNVLLDKDLVCKISDFGSARDIVEMREYETSANQKLPLRWMAPESLLSCIYSSHSDVWSFGVFLWEVVTLGSSPYPGMTSEQVMDFVQKGCRMAKPTHCSQSLYTLMTDCWHHFPPSRPSFATIHDRLTTLLEEEGDNMFVDQMSDNAYNILLNQSREKC
ncbi:hypothetical protein CAPTEDRAFT_104413 [Capitella teleta]|uniref:receptor protein-tyrosine kinase n=1 Tax=Capitella teleta TaxID=283909 RepID=R7VHW5_CAPTE|nr:hypothetical protein CAPTEDRAFT_104413 [Capitella teleta]|eukprot:ELU15290.1 hypothetical protein CAPTEDRAFT_104413 [Capitella teleta]